MKKVVIAIGVVIGLFLILGIAQIVASESGEVLVLETLDSDGQPHETRIWLVDDAGAIWVRGRPDSGWVQRLLESPDIRAKRSDRWAPFRAVPGRATMARDRVNVLMRKKYGFADRFIAITLGDAERKGVLPFRLDPR